MEKLLTHTLFLVVIILFALNLQPSKAAGPECVKAKNPTMATKPHVVLVHGFMSGGWCWYKVRSTLETLGYTVTSIDLKGAGIDPTDPSTVLTIDQLSEPLDKLMAALPPNEKVALVAHSAGGVGVTKMLHDYPDKVQFAVYVVATMLKNGYNTCEDLTIGVPYFKDSKCSASCPKQLPDPTCFDIVISPGELDMPLAELEGYSLAKSLLRKGPYRAICTSKFADKGLGIDKVPRVFVKTLNDKELLPEQQDMMIKLWPPCEVHEIPNGHDVPGEKPEFIVASIVNATLSYSA